MKSRKRDDWLIGVGDSLKADPNTFKTLLQTLSFNFRGRLS